MNRLQLAILVGTAIPLGACGTTVHYAATNASPRSLASRPSQTVEVFTATMPERPFVEVGLLEAQQSSAVSFDDQPAVLAKLREEAGRIGCDGLVLLGANDSVVGGGGKQSSHTATLKGYRATCVVYRDAAPTTPAAKP